MLCFTLYYLIVISSKLITIQDLNYWWVRKRFLFLTIQDSHTTEIPFRIPEQAEQLNNIIVNSVIQQEQECRGREVSVPQL